MAFLMGSPNQVTLPIIAVRDGIVFPKTENVLIFGRLKSITTINEALKSDKRIVLVMQKTHRLKIRERKTFMK